MLMAPAAADAADLLYRDYGTHHKFTLTTCTPEGVVSILPSLSLSLPLGSVTHHFLSGAICILVSV